MDYRVEDLDRVRLMVKESAVVTVYDEDGVIIAEVGFGPGLHRVGDLAQWLPAGSLWTADGAYVTARNGRGIRVPYGPGHFDTGANPDFRPRRMTDGEATLHRMVRGLQQQMQEVRTSARLRAGSRPDGPSEEAPQVEVEVLVEEEEQDGAE